MELTWPLVGRSAELERVGALLESRSGAVILAGPAGVGKTRLATECLGQAVARGYAALHVSATSATAELPFGAFSALLPELPETGRLAVILRHIADSIGERGGGSPVALMVDDAHLLDDSSASLTYQLARGTKTFVIATVRSGSPAPAAVVALWKDGLVERLEVDPLPESQVDELLQRVLGGPVDRLTLQLLREKTRGNAQLLRELVLGAIEAGALQETHGLWRLAGTFPISPRLGEIIESRLAKLPPAELEALALIAVGEPLGVGIFELVERGFDLNLLVEKGLVHVIQDERRLVLRLDHPLHGEILRAQLSPLTARRLAARLAEAVESTGLRRRTDALPVAVWRLHAGGPFRADLMLAAALTARSRSDFPLAERLARTALDAGAGFDAALLSGQLRWYQKRAVEADTYLESITPLAVTDAQKAQLASARIEILDLGLNDDVAALSVAEKAETSIGDEALRDQIAAERARILGRHGQNAAAVAIVVPLIERTQGRTLIAACFAAATNMSVTGQCTQGMAAVELGYATHMTLEGPPVGFPPALHKALGCLVLSHAGLLEEARQLGSAGYAQALGDHSPLAIGFFCVMLALTRIYEGKCVSAERYAGEALIAFRQIGFPLMERNALLELSYARAMRGATDGARQALAEVDDLGVPTSAHSGPLLLQARAWVEMAAGDIPRATELLAEGVELARWSGARALESWVLHDYVRLGRADEVAERLQELSTIVEGPFVAARAIHASAMANGNAIGLEAGSRAFEKLGSLLGAAEAATDAALVWRRQGDLRKATAAERRSGFLAARCEGATSLVLVTLAPVRATLTDRELEIARLAASGSADKVIAQRLHLSPRTVQNNLYSAYTKLGVTGRAELRTALEGS